MMEEDEYKSTYNELASVRCVFEKALTNNHAKCHLSRHFYLADREGYACKAAESSIDCAELLEKLRKKSLFVFKLRNIAGSLPHNMELRVQAGGIIGLQKSVDMQGENKHGTAAVENINGVLSRAVEKFGSLENFPFSEIIQSVKQFQSRQRRHR